MLFEPENVYNFLHVAKDLNQLKIGSQMSDQSQDSMQDFEQALEKLEAIVSKMEQGKLSLEQSLSAFEEGVRLTRNCQESLRTAEQRVSKLIQDGEQLGEQAIDQEKLP